MGATEDWVKQIMRISYYPTTDSLYIEFSETPSSDSREVAEGVVLDYDVAGKLVGIDIDDASTKVALDKLIFSSLPGTVVSEL
jgi:uncharacterized protein YuzE